VIHGQKIRVHSWFRPLKKTFKKVKKKLATPWRLPLNGGFEGTNRPQKPFKKTLKKVKKKLVSAIEV
jgi:hypothetical protein